MRYIPSLIINQKKEFVGNFKNNGATWSKEPVAVFDHDFRINTTKTFICLKDKAYVESKCYRKGVKIYEAEMISLILILSDVIPKWNYDFADR